MTLKGIFGYKNADSSTDYNARTARTIDRAILDGGSISYNGTLAVTIAPFIAHGYDGMTVISDTSLSVTLVDGAVNYIICFAQYQNAASPVVEIQVITEAAWLSLTNRDYFITFAKFDLSVGIHLLVTAADADYSVSDYSDKLGKGNWRRAAATQATLPTIQNRDGDTRIALDDRISYTWNSTLKVWSATKTKAAQVTFAAYPGISALDTQAAIQELKGNINDLVASNVAISDRVIYSTYANSTFKFYVPFIRKFVNVPASIDITTILGDETNVTSVTVSGITINGFTLSVTPTVTGMTTLARDWVTL